MVDPDLGHWALMNDLFYAESSQLVGRLLKGESIRDLYDERKDRISSKAARVDRYEARLKLAAESDVDFLLVTDSSYPSRLRETPEPPLLIYRRGNYTDFRRAVAVAGRRNLSFRGHSDARTLGRELGSRGFLVVSGLARGADTEAHCGALEGGGETVAMLAGWLDDVYPKENASLAQDIVRRGALMTMTSPLKNVQRHYFIRRNRLTSGVSGCLVIVESNGEGGTARQLDWALEQKRPILMLKPDPKNREAAEAYRRFTATGAKGFPSVDDLVEYVETMDFNEEESKSVGRRRITDYDQA